MALNFLLYLLYGLVFFTLGVAILSRDIKISELGIARIIWLLAVFGIIHGFHEWLELLEQLDPSIKSPLFVHFRLAVVSLSFLFLLYNSLDACQQEDSITVETLFKEGCVLVEITDTGHGISEDNLSKVFDPFFTTKEVGKGAGLGLSVCYNILQQHGGKLSILSSENGGTIVTLSFPVTTNGK